MYIIRTQQFVGTEIYIKSCSKRAVSKNAEVKINGKNQITKAQAKAALEATTNALKEALIAGDKIQLVGFGTFSINERPAREGINPATKEKIQIAAKKVAKFKAGAELADAINK